MLDMPDELIKVVIPQIKLHEGYRKYPYKCTAGKLTCGYGHNIQDVGISQSEAEYLLINDVKAVWADLQNIFTLETLLSFPIPVLQVLVNMRFQMGAGGFRTFKNTISYCKKRLWKHMAYAMRESKWYQQTPNRAEELASLIEGVKEA